MRLSGSQSFGWAREWCVWRCTGAGLSAQQQQPGLGARPQGSPESRSGAKPGEGKASDPLSFSAGSGIPCLCIN